jgi:Cupin domain
MSIRLITRSARGVHRSALVAGGFATVAIVVVAAVAVATAAAESPTTIVAAQDAPTGSMTPFEVTGLPAGAARGVPAHTTLPPSFTLKHVHGGPSYVYVIAGSVDITEADGQKTTYDAGQFFWEPAGRVHTVQTTERAELFILQFLPPGAEGTIPAQ